MKKLLMALALASVLPGCASQMTPAQQASVLQAQAERPTLAVTCPAGSGSVVAPPQTKKPGHWPGVFLCFSVFFCVFP